MEIDENGRIAISDAIHLRTLTGADQAAAYTLMKRVYPQAYHELWPDQGTWYVDQIYGKATFEKETAEPNTHYYYIQVDSKEVGVLRIQEDQTLLDFPEKQATKLQRIYLDASVHGKGIGKTVLNWTAEQAAQKGYAILWVEVMDSQQQAIQFYRKCGFEISSRFRLTYELMYPALRGMYRMYRVLEKA